MLWLCWQYTLKGMRSIFDQYTQPENRLTHALVCTLNANRRLLRPFLRWAGATDVPRLAELKMTEQQVPGEVTPGDEEESRGLPDACFFTEDGWALLVEAKVQARVKAEQLRRHIATAHRHGYDRPHLLVLSVDGAPHQLPEWASHRTWRELYAWLRERSDSVWADRLAEYLEVFESRMIADNYSIRGTLTMFDGLRFDADHPYNYREAKRLIRLLGDELQQRRDLHKIGLDPRGARRPAITGSSENRVWDFLPLKEARGAANFTDFPHCDIGIHRDHAVAAVVVPNGVRGGFRSRLQEAGVDGFVNLMTEIEQKLRIVIRQSPGARPAAYASQRHYRSQRSTAQMDARLEVDLRTLLPGSKRETKYQPEWIWAVYDVLTNKRSNIQFEVVVEFSYECPAVRSPRCVDLFAKSWIAISPLLDFVLGRR